MNNRNNDSHEDFYLRGESGNSSQQSNGFQISTDNYYYFYEPNQSRVEIGIAQSYVTPPARQLEKLEYKNSWFHPPQKSKKFVKINLDSDEIKQISKKLNFFDESFSSTSQASNNTNSYGPGVQANDSIDNISYEEYPNTYGVFGTGNSNIPNQTGINNNNGNICFQKNRNNMNTNTYIMNNTNNRNINNNHNFTNQNHICQQNSETQNTNSNNRNNYKYSKTTSNPESILKFR